MNDFVYIFKFRNGGITLNGAKSKFQTLFQTNNADGKNHLFEFLKDPQKGNITLLRSLAESAGIPQTLEILDNPQLFKQKLIDDTSSSLYKFIKIQSDL